MIVVDGATHSQKDGVEGNGGSLKDVEQRPFLCCSCAALSWFCGLMSSQYLIFYEVNVTLKNAEIFGSVLSGESGYVGGGPRCCKSAPGLLQLPPATPKNPPPFMLGVYFFSWRPLQHPDGWR